MDNQYIKIRQPKRISNVIGIITYFTALFFYIIYLFILTLSLENNIEFYNGIIFILSWLGIFTGVYVFVTWYKLTGAYFTTYTIFMFFFFIFTFGQCIMWAFGIHMTDEIGNKIMYPGFGVPNGADIANAQILTIMSILMFHSGAVFSYKGKGKNAFTTKNINSINVYKNTLTLKSIYYVCLVAGIVVIPITLYYSIKDFQISRVYGYSALYYSEFARQEASIMGLLTKMFFPCLVGLLIGSKYNRKVQAVVYTIFIVYLIVNLLSGDRGSWVYKLIILVWLSHVCYKPINIKKLVKYLVVVFIGLHFISIIVSFRDIGVSNIDWKTAIKQISLENSPIISVIFEMGGSMAPTIVLQKYGWDVWPYANTYLLAILGMITNRVIYTLDIPFELLSTWFSQGYLGISWGAGFSIIAEALLNYGPIFAPLFLMLQGYIIVSAIYVDKGMNYIEHPLRFFFAASTLSFVISIIRNELHIKLKEWFYGVVVLYICILLVNRFLLKLRKRN